MKQIIKKPPEFFLYKNKMFKLIEQCNNDVYLYQEVRYGYKMSFSAFDLGLIEEVEVEKEAKGCRK